MLDRSEDHRWTEDDDAEDEEVTPMGDDDIERLLGGPIATAGFELIEIELRPALLRVIVDSEDGAGLDRLAEVTRAVSAVLDEHDPFPGRRYTLEVSSPGVERSLRTPRHFQRAIGEDVTIRTIAGTEGERRVQGRLAAVDDESIVVEGVGLPDGGRRIMFEEVERARTVFTWGSSSGPATGSERRGKPARPAGSPRPAATGRR